MKKGFTLIELLVVISIIGVLATIVLGSLNEARTRAKDVRTTQAVTQLRTGLELFFLDNNRYPDSRNQADWIGVCNAANAESGYYNADFMNDLAPYIPSLAVFEDCTDIYYFSKPLQAYYLGVCNVNQYTDEQGYALTYATSADTRHNQFYFWSDPSTGANWHCRSYDG